jgi:hypothetical protein
MPEHTGISFSIFGRHAATTGFGGEEFAEQCSIEHLRLVTRGKERKGKTVKKRQRH